MSKTTERHCAECSIDLSDQVAGQRYWSGAYDELCKVCWGPLPHDEGYVTV